jgi:hypothetical protein
MSQQRALLKGMFWGAVLTVVLVWLAWPVVTGRWDLL